MRWLWEDAWKRHVGPFCVDKMALDLNFYANGFVKMY